LVVSAQGFCTVANRIIDIDGSLGEGGGQVLRTSVGLSSALGVCVRLTNIRAGRPKSGLRAQHVAAVKAAAEICGAELSGAKLGSGELTFRPGQVRRGRYRFDIGTAGSTTLVLQTVIPALMLSDGASQVTVTGGTHNPKAPCFEYLRDVFGVLASAANLQAYFELKRAGFAPAGGGKVTMQIQGLGRIENVAPLRLSSRGELKYIEGVSSASDSLPAPVGDRQATAALRRLAAAGRQATIEQACPQTDSPGTALFLRAVFSRTVAGFSALGGRGGTQEGAADRAVDGLLDFLDAAGVVDAHAADQLLTIAGICCEESSFATSKVTSHLLTNAEVIRRVTGREVIVQGAPGRPGEVIVSER